MTSLDFNFAEPIASYDDSVDASMDVIPADIGSIKKSDFVVLNGRPLKVVEVTHSQPGKHGHSKVFQPFISLPFSNRFFFYSGSFDWYRYIHRSSYGRCSSMWTYYSNAKCYEKGLYSSLHR